MAEDRKQTPGQERYARLNGLWPQTLPALTDQEALSAAKRLYRLGVGRAFKGTFKLTSGNRHTWVQNGVFVVNPSKGWRDLVHSVSHLAHYKTHAGKSGHHWTHIAVERKFVEHVLKHGWLDGALRRPERAKPDLKTVRFQRVLTRIEQWEGKKRRAERALAKLYQSKQYYERQARSD
jgi:hypothetical protein